MTEGEESGRSRKSYDPKRVRTEKSFGVDDERHWAKARGDLHQEEIEFLREKSRAPGVAEGGGLRNHYCMECNGVIPLAYDSRASVEAEAPESCPHCGAKLEGGVRMMFNWVEMDQVPGSDLRALLPFLAGGMIFLVILAILLWQYFSKGS
jgi:hypothetical protein